MDDEEFYLSIKSHSRKIEDVRNVFKNLTESEQATLEFEKNRAEMVGLVKKYLNNTSLDKLYTTRKIIDEMIALVLLNETKNAIQKKKQQQQQQQQKKQKLELEKQVRLERVKSEKKLFAQSFENLENIDNRVIFFKDQNSTQNQYNSHHQYSQYHYYHNLHRHHHHRHSNHNHKRKETHSEEIEYYLKYLDDLEYRRKHSVKQETKMFMKNCEFNFENMERTIPKCISPSYIR